MAVNPRTPLPPPRNFPFTWDDPADAERYWRTDLVHHSYPHVPLYNGLEAAFDGAQVRLPHAPQAPGERRRLVVNGYVYFDATEPRALPPLPDGLAEIDLPSHWAALVPEIEAITTPLKAAPLDEMDLPALVAHAAAIERAGPKLWDLHGRAVRPARFAVVALERFCASAGVADAEREQLLRGFDNLALRSSQEQWELGQLAAADPRLRDAVLEHRPEEVEAALRSLGDVATPLLDGVDAHAARFGWRPASLHPMGLPVIDDRTPIWEVVRASASGEMESPIERHERIARQREATTAAIRARLDADARAEFDRLYARAGQFVQIFEDHNIYIDQTAYAVTLRFCDRFARRLHAAGLVESARDAYFLTPEELPALDLERPGAALQATLTQRRAEWERCCAFTPPLALGTRPRRDEDFADHFIGVVHGDGENPRILAGIGVSPGAVTGTARILREMSEADRLAAGDILVCITTLPPWTPLFARIGGVVTVGGGTLSHAAITAREYGIPAVLSVADATTRIRDGQRVTVDGSNGIVRLED
jgi:pyruvate,water dikinase